MPFFASNSAWLPISAMRPLVQHHDAVCLANRREPVSDDERRAVLQQLTQRALDDHLGLRVDVGRRFVQHEDARLRHDGAGEADELSLAQREVLAALLQDRVVAVLQAHDELVRTYGGRGLLDLLIGRIRPSVGDVLAHGAREQVRLLQHHTHVARQRAALDVADVVAVDADRARR